MQSDISENEVYTYASKDVIVGVSDQTIEQAISMININKFRRLPIVADTELIGILTATDIIKYIVENRGQSPINTLLAEPVERIMTKEVITSPCEASIQKAAEIMTEKRIGGLPLMANNQLVDIITERDMLALYSLTSIYSEILVRDVMTKDVITISPNNTLIEAMEKIVSAKIRRLPVIQPDEGIIGLICIHDIFRQIGDLKITPESEDAVFGTTLDKIMATTLVCINANDSLTQAASTMAWMRHGALPVTEETKSQSHYGQLIGIITERDILRVISQPFNQK